MNNVVKEFAAESFDLTKLLDLIQSLGLKISAREKLLVILGATATGKSSLALRLAEILDTEIISADSMAVYKGFNIGTAKPSAAELQRVKHHLINILEPEEKFSVAEFVRRAEPIITELNSRRKIPIVVGGTGLYIQALVEGYHFKDNSKSLSKVFKDTGELKYDTLVIGLTANRAELYQRIDERTRKMFDAGLLDEVQKLLASGVPAGAQAMLGIGYKQAIEHLRDGLSLDETIAKVSQATRNFAKRQLTWYRRMNYIKFFNVA